MTVAAINRFISLLDDAFKGLSAKVAMDDVERLAMLIHHSMDQGRRTYHTSTHLFDMCEGMSPRQVLAVLFHDVVYYQLDHGFPQRADTMLKRAIRVERDALMLRSFNSSDLELSICTGVFGFKAGQTLPLYGGMNEFLSAVVSVRLLRPYLQPADLVAIVACIEATVPFRRNDAGGKGPFDRLAERLRALPHALRISLPDAGIDAMVTDAVLLANRDVSSFSEADPATFLATTWLLIEESNAPLAAVGVYSIEDYRGALTRMETFLSTLDAASIFHGYKGIPADAELRALSDSARRNLEFASRYLGAKIVSIAVVEALAGLTGGNCPVSMFLGDIRSPYGRPDRVEDFLPEATSTTAIDPQLLSVLEGGRSRESTNDLTASPLTGFIYRCIGGDGMPHALQQAKRMFGGELPARDFLGGLDREMVRAVASACARIAVSRKAALLFIGQSLQ